MSNIYNSQLDAFELYHKTLEENTRSPQNGPVLPALGHALAGSVGSAISNLTLYPLDLVITRLQVQRQLRKTFTSAEDGEYKGVLDAFAQIYYKEGGIFAFYKGLIQDTGKSFADSFLFFLFYNYARSNRLHQRGGNAKSLPILDELSVGAVAGACSKFFTTPIANIVTRKKTAAMLSARSGSIYKEPTVAEIASDIRSEKGFQGFWSGYSASLVLTLNPSITFFLYEFFKRCLPRSKRDDPRAILTFLMAAVSKAIASTITYPFSLAKTRAQISKAPPVNPDSVADFKEEVEGIDNKPIMRKAGRGLKDLAQRSTVFNTIFQIYRTEGVAALYEGISGEILKGFFSHGITMLIKEAVHKLIIQTYFLILKAIRKYPSPSELATQAGGAVQENAEKASVMVKDGYETVIGKAEETVQDGKKSLGAVKERIDNVGGSATEVLKSVRQGSKEAADIAGSNAAEVTKTVLHSGSDKAAFGAVGAQAGAAEESAKNMLSGGEFASKEAAHVLGNAQEQLGGKINELGKAIEPEE